MPLSRSEIEEYFDLDPGAIDEVERQIKENHEKNVERIVEGWKKVEKELAPIKRAKEKELLHAFMEKDLLKYTTYYLQQGKARHPGYDPYIKVENTPEARIIETKGSVHEIKTIIEDCRKQGIKIGERKRKSRTVAGRRKLPEGKKARPEKKGSTEFEMELVHYLIQMFNMPPAVPHHVWRSPSSESPVDVWSVAKNIGTEKCYGSMVCCHQCKTTKDTKPPRIDKNEFDKFVAFCNGIGAKALWVDRWKKNKNVYIRRIRFVDSEGQLFTHVEDFSNDIKRKAKKPIIDSTSQARI